MASPTSSGLLCNKGFADHLRAYCSEPDPFAHCPASVAFWNLCARLCVCTQPCIVHACKTWNQLGNDRFCCQPEMWSDLNGP